jgi:RHS repeat-associated protein
MGEVVKNLRSVAVAGYHSYWFYTSWKYDTWNRVREIMYPDREKVTYKYNTGGNVNQVTSQFPSLSTTNIVTSITYDDFGSRDIITYGNGTSTKYTYDTRRRMNSLKYTFTGFTQTKNYGYDVLSNIDSITTYQPQNVLPGAGVIGGPVNHAYEYDSYNRLTHAEGNYVGPNDLTTPYLRQEYELDMTYNTDHTIKTKTQSQQMGTVATATAPITTPIPVYKNSYALDYSEYATGALVAGSYGYQQPHAVRKIVENPTWVTNPATDDPRIRQKEIEYDANGNQLEIKEKVGEEYTSLRKNLWDEENRLKAVNLKPDESTNHPIAIYTYDAGGERIVRYNLDHIDVASNAKEVAQKATDNVMMYPSGLVMAKATRLDKENTLSYTKHYYVGSERVSAKTGTVAQLGIYPGNLMVTEMPGLNTTMIRNASNTSVTDAGTAVTAVYSAFSLTPPVMDPVVEPDRENYLHDMAKMNAYYFHSDHLGSSSFMTNASGKAIQHMEYLPFGETLVDEHTNSFSSPFKFNAKEFDEETGNYYYGARYYDPKWSIFISVDPLAEKYPNWSSYAYGFNNPLRFIDPTGNENEDIIEIGKNGIYFNITKAAGDDVVKLVEFKDGEKSTVNSYVYGKNGSFENDTYDRNQYDDFGKLKGLELHFSGSADKADKFFKFAADADYEWALMDVFYSKSGYGETVVSTDYHRTSVGNSAKKVLNEFPDSYITRLAHSHPEIGEPYPSGFNQDFTPNPSFDGDRNRYLDLMRPQYKGRIPDYEEVHISWKNYDLKYNDKEVIKK